MSAQGSSHAASTDAPSADAAARPVARALPPARLEPLSMVHAPAMLRWMHDPAVTEPLGIRGTPSMARTRHWLERAIAEQEVVARAIVLEGTHVGNVVLDQLDRCARSARLSIYIGEASARGRGVGQWAVREAVRLAFDALGLERVWLTVRHDNAAARRAYEQAGFAVEPAAAWASDGEQGASLLMSRRAR